MNRKLELPRLYAIVDLACFPQPGQWEAALYHASELIAGRVTLLQYRDKQGSARDILFHAREFRRMAPRSAKLIMNDRADLCVAAGFDGVHVGQDDISPEAARKIVGPERIVGVSTHNVEQVRQADTWPVDYIAIGPVFQTSSKANPDPVVGLEGIRAARALTRKPLVAIGGITLDNCAAVLEAGADSVALISGLLDSPRERAEEFRRSL